MHRTEEQRTEDTAWPLTRGRNLTSKMEDHSVVGQIVADCYDGRWIKERTKVILIQKQKPENLAWVGFFIIVFGKWLMQPRGN